MMEIRFKYKVALSSIVILMVFVTLTGVSYAYFTTEIAGISNPVEVVTADVEMTFTERGEDINLENAYPIPQNEALSSLTPYTFSLTNPNTFAVKAYVFINILNDSDNELLPYINMAYDKGDGKGYQVSKINSCNVNSEVIDGAKKSCLIDTIDLTSQASKNDLKLLFWIDEKAGSIQECTYAENGGQTCTTNPDPTMNKTFEAKVAVRTLANRDAQTVNSGDPVVFTEP